MFHCNTKLVRPWCKLVQQEAICTAAPARSYVC